MGKDKGGDKAAAKLNRQLYDAVKSGDTGTVKSLLAVGGDPNAPVGKKGMTAMERAASQQDQSIEEVLFKSGGTLHSSSTLAAKLSLGFQGEAGSFPNDEPDDRAGTFVAKKSASGPSGLNAATASLVKSAEDDGGGTFVPRRPGSTNSLEPPVEDGATSSMTRALPVRMSRLSNGVASSVRMKKKKLESNPAAVQEENSEWTVDSGGADLPHDNENRNWEFDRAKLVQVAKLGSGQFGIVFEGVARGILPGEEETRVAVKMLSAKSAEDEEEFGKEAAIMMMLSGDNNLVRLLGVCTTEEPKMMIMELMANGDLKSFLRGVRPKAKTPSILSPKRIGLMSADIANGMRHLEKMKVIHRDLAARNVLVHENLSCKIGDFGLTRDNFQGDYYRMTGSAPLPIRWMAPESIMDGTYSSLTDVWAFGIVLWEITSFAKMPYAGLSNMEVCEKVTEDDYRLAPPKDCPAPIIPIMEQCWEEEPSDRSTFASIHEQLVSIAATLTDERISKGKKPRKGDQDLMEDPNEALREHRENLEDGDYAEPADVALPGVAAVYSQIDRGASSSDEEGANYQGPDGGMYVREGQKPDVDDQLLYTDNRYEGLSSMELAIKHAKNTKDIVSVKLDKAAGGKVRQGSVEEEYMPQTTDMYATVQKGAARKHSATLRKDDDVPPEIPPHLLPSDEALKRLAIQEPSLDNPDPSYMQVEEQVSKASGSGGAAGFQGVYNHESALAKKLLGGSPAAAPAAKAKAEAEAETAEPGSAGAKYDHEDRLAAKLLGTTAPPPRPTTSAGDGAASRKTSTSEDSKYSHENRLAKMLGVDPNQQPPPPKQASAPPAAETAASKPKPKYGGATSWVTSAPASVSVGNVNKKKKEAKVNPKWGGATSWVTAGQAPADKGLNLGAKGGPPAVLGSGGVATVAQAKSAPPVVNTPLVDLDGMPVDASANTPLAQPVTRALNEVVIGTPQQRTRVESQIPLSNDHSKTAAQAQKAGAKILDKAEKDTVKWLEAVIGDYLPDGSLQEALRNGQILCDVMNKVKPGSVPKVHRTRMVFKQMENIGRFLDAARQYGVSSSDLFTTVDLFENANMKQVIICISALQARASVNGFHV